MKKYTIKTFVAIGMLSSIAYILMVLNFPLPPFPSYLKVDFSEIPALIATLIFGPVAGILVEFIKNVLDYFITGSETAIPVGHFANFIAGLMFILPTYFIYKKVKTKKGLAVALAFSSVTMAVTMAFLNYFVLLPSYTFFLNMPAMSGPEIRKLIIAFIIPFNLLKGVMITVLFLLLFTKMGNWIEKQHTLNRA
ncbi:ECF transporter S component [Bacillaceae bacterium Marseille-Q3522]|nr:ECF transporter S component [Bacillaceae bacterium Marseille-Q3522]